MSDNITESLVKHVSDGKNLLYRTAPGLGVFGNITSTIEAADLSTYVINCYTLDSQFDLFTPTVFPDGEVKLICCPGMVEAEVIIVDGIEEIIDESIYDILKNLMQRKEWGGVKFPHLKSVIAIYREGGIIHPDRLVELASLTSNNVSNDSGDDDFPLGNSTDRHDIFVKDSSLITASFFAGLKSNHPDFGTVEFNHGFHDNGEYTSELKLDGKILISTELNDGGMPDYAMLEVFANHREAIGARVMLAQMYRQERDSLTMEGLFGLLDTMLAFLDILYMRINDKVWEIRLPDGRPIIRVLHKELAESLIDNAVASDTAEDDFGIEDADFSINLTDLPEGSLEPHVVGAKW